MGRYNENGLARRICRCLLTGVLWLGGATAQSATVASDAIPGKSKALPSAVVTAKGRGQPQTDPSDKTSKPTAGFTITSTPTWVQPLAVDASMAVPAAPLQLLLVDRQTRVEAAGTVHYSHFVRRVNDTAGLQKAAQIEVEFDPSYQKLTLHQLTLWRGTHRIDKLDAQRVKILHRETQLERQMVDGRMTASIVLDDLRVGDRVEWAMSLSGDNPVFNGRFVDTEWSISALGPTGNWQLRLLAAPGRDIRHRVREPAIEVSSNVRGGWRETVFRRRAAPQFRYDEQLPPREYLRDQIELSEFADWAEVSAWGETLFAKAMRPSAALETRVAEIQAQAATPEERLRIALDFVQKDIRYFGTEIGPDSHQPAYADTVLRQRFGDCKDKVALLVAMLRDMGVSATPVLVSTNYRDEVRDRLPSPLAFDHAIARVTLDGKTFWLDGTRSQQSGPAAARQAEGLGYGLLAQAPGASLQALPSTRDSLRSETVDTFSFPRLAQEGSLESVTTYYGYAAEGLREAMANMPLADFQKILVQDATRAYPDMVATAPPEVTPVTELNALRVTLRFRTGTYWRFPEQRLLVGDFALMGLVAPVRLPDQTPRTQPLRLGLPGRYRHTVKYQFGEPVFGQSSANQFDEVNKHFELHLRYDGGTHEQRVEGELRQLAEVIEAADWLGYRQTLNKVAPRFSGMVSVPAVPPDQADTIRADLKALDESLRRGQLKVVTQEQVSIRAKLAVLERQLAAGRLAPKLRAEALVAQGAQLDHLNRLSEAQSAFQQAIELDATNAEARQAMAVNAFLRRQDNEAVEHATQALQMTPSNVGPRYTRAWARYFAGDTAQSRDEFKDILQSSRAEVDRSYGAIWLYLAARRLGDDGAAAVQTFLPSSTKPAWPYPVLQWLKGDSSFDAALAAAREDNQSRRGRECELYFFAGQKALLDADTATAKTQLRKSIATGVVEFTEYAMAQRELDRIGAR